MRSITAFDFKKADAGIAELESSFPDDPSVKLLRLYKYYWRFLLAPYDKTAFLEFDEAVQETLVSIDTDSLPGSPREILFRSLALVLGATVFYEKGMRLNAWSSLRKAGNVLENLEGDQYTAGDASFLEGSYEYYRLRSSTEAALTLLDKAAETGVYFRDLALLLKAQILEREFDDLESAFSIYDELYDTYPGNSLMAFYLAKNLQRQEQYEESLRTYRVALETIHYNPEPIELLCRIHFSLGQIYEQNKNDLPQAFESYSKVLKIADPDIPETAWFIPRSNLHAGSVLYRMGNHSQALELLRSVERGDDPEAYKKAFRLIAEIEEKISDR